MSQPVWSPVDNRIAFVWFKPKEKQQSVFVVNRDGSNFRRIESLVADAPAWSPSGDQRIYTEEVVGSDSQIFKVDLTTHKITQLTDKGSNRSGNWFDPKQLAVSPSASHVTTSWGAMKTED